MLPSHVNFYRNNISLLLVIKLIGLLQVKEAKGIAEHRR